jgi:hypothetical protein
METYTTNTHTIAISLNERTIYMKLTDKVNFMTYEANLDDKELRLTIELVDAYRLMCNCFAGIDGHKMIASVNAGIMRVAFSALVGGYLNMNFEVILKEKIMSNDGQLTTTITRLEQKQNAMVDYMGKKHEELQQKIQEISAILDAVSSAYIFMGGGKSNFHVNLFVSINSINLIFRHDQDMDLERIKILYKLETVTCFYYRANDFTKLSNRTVREVIIECHNEGHLTQFDGLSNLPNLELLTVKNAPNLNPTRFISNKYKVKKLMFQGCPLLTSSLELREYCAANDIALVVS